MGGGEVYVLQGLGTWQQVALANDLFGQRLGNVSLCVLPEGTHQIVDTLATEPYGGEFFGGGVDSLHTEVTAREEFFHQFNLGVYDAHLATEEGGLAQHHILPADLQLFLYPRGALKPNQFGHTAPIGETHGESLLGSFAEVGKARNAPTQLHVDIALLLGEGADAEDLGAVNVAVWVVVQQVAHRAYARLCSEQLGTLFAHPTQKFYVHIGSHKANIRFICVIFA